MSDASEDSTTKPTRLAANPLSRIWRHLSLRRHRQLVILLGLMVVSSFAEVISIGAVVPFLAVLANPMAAMQQPYVAWVATTLGITSVDQLTLVLAVGFIIASIVASGFRILQIWANTHLANAAGRDISVEIFRRTLYQPYKVHLERNSSEVISTVVAKADTATYVIFQLLLVFSTAVLAVSILLALLAINPAVTVIALVGFGAAYLLISSLVRRQLERNGQRIAVAAAQRIKALHEGLGGIRDVLLDGSQPFFTNYYEQADIPLRRSSANSTVIGYSPRYLMEAVGMVMITVLAYVLSRQDNGLASALPLLGALAIGAQRLLPALQQSYFAWTSVIANYAMLTDVADLLDQPLPPEATSPEPAPLPFHQTIQFVDVRFRYNDDGPWVLDGVNLTVSQGSRVGFVGTTGSGKSTTLDLLMGLLDPTEGQILVDGESIVGQQRRAWQRTVAHVPQSIFLADTTLAENIAFGVPAEAIDMERVRHAAEQAQIASFIEASLDGYAAMVGERGIRLSGGQRQRIGIARALYKQATVLIFDEATSALDNATEQAVMEAIENLGRDLTILIIAHRLTTVQRCDLVVELEMGRVAAAGAYSVLLRDSPTFRALAQVT